MKQIGTISMGKKETMKKARVSLRIIYVIIDLRMPNFSIFSLK